MEAVSEVLVKYKTQFGHFNRQTIEPLFKQIYVWDLDADKDLSKASHIDPNKTVAIGDNISNALALRVTYEHKVRHIVQANRFDFFPELMASAMMLKTPEKFMKNPLPFFLKVVAKDSLESLLQRQAKFSFISSFEKKKIVEKIEDYLEEEKATSIFHDTVLTIVNELMLNALFDAPVDSSGTHLNLTKNRSNYIKYPDGKEGLIYMANDPKRLFIACEDPFGSISYPKLLRRLYEIYYKKDSSPSGLGVKMVIDNSSGIYFVKKSSVKTLVCCSFPLGMGLRKALRVPKTFHFCEFR